MYKFIRKYHYVIFAGLFAVLLFAFMSSHLVSAISSTGIIEPLYSKPFVNGSFYWQPIVYAKTLHPNVPFIAVVNPDDGPGSLPPTCVSLPNIPGNLTRDYQNGVGNLTKAGVVVLGYVDTVNTTTGIQKQYGQVKSEIDTWTSCYPGVSGIMFDDMQTFPFTTGNLTYYQNLTNYVHNDKKLEYSFGNPGSDTDPRFLNTVDALNISDDGTLPQDSSLRGENDWHLQYDKSHFTFVAYDQPNLPNQTWLQEESLYVKYLFFTNATSPNPWNSIPSYLTNETAAVNTPSLVISIDSIEQNGTSLPGPLVTIGYQINQISNPTRVSDTPFTYNTTSGLIYKITAQQNYGNWKFDYWKFNPLQLNLSNKILTSPYNSTIYVLPMSSLTLTATYKCDANCTQTTSDPPLISGGTYKPDPPLISNGAHKSDPHDPGANHATHPDNKPKKYLVVRDS